MKNVCALRPILASLGSLVFLQGVAIGQTCGFGWTENLFPLAGVDGEVYATLTWNDGDGQALYIGGEFTIAGSVNASNVARWDGERWTALGSGTGGVVRSFGVFDDGSGEAIYVGGDFLTAGGLEAAHIARWDGSQWSALDDGVNGPVRAMAASDDRLYVGGEFSLASGEAARNLAWWDGDSWSGPPNGTSAPIHALLVHDDGTGEQLYVGGRFTIVGAGVSANRIARWNPATQVWSAVGSGMTGGGSSGGVYALAAFDDGNGVDVYAGGRFTTAGGMSIEGLARWDGSAWSGLGAGVDGGVVALTVIDDADGLGLIAAGPFERAGGEFLGNGVARWDGSQWATLGAGLLGIFDFYPRAVAVLDVGDGPRMYTGGNLAGRNGITMFEDGHWQDLVEAGRAAELAGSGPVAVLDFDGTTQMYFSGDFPVDGGGEAHVGRWDGENVEVLFGGEQLPAQPSGLAVFDDGTGPAIYASGMSSAFDEYPVMRWDGAGWQFVGSPTLLGSGSATLVFDDGSGSALYVGGRGLSAGGVALGELARWDGVAWSAVGGGVFEGDRFGGVDAFEVFDDGRGTALYAAGSLGLAGGEIVNMIARWDGSDWTDAGMGLDGTQIYDLEVYDDGEGPTLFATGQIVNAGGSFSLGIARWENDQWGPLDAPSGLSGPGFAFSTFDNGHGEALYVGGPFTFAGGVEVSRIGRWDGLAWSPVDGGLDGSASRLIVFDDGAGLAMFAGGSFDRAGGHPSAGIARYGCQPVECRVDLDGDGELTIFDFLGFQNLFDAGDLAADFDGDGSLTIFDFLVYQNEFDAGCE